MNNQNDPEPTGTAALFEFFFPAKKTRPVVKVVRYPGDTRGFYHRESPRQRPGKPIARDLKNLVRGATGRGGPPGH